MTDIETPPENGQRVNGDPMVLSYLTMRLILGVLGVSLPLTLLIGGLLTEGYLRGSISAFYHSPCFLLHGLFVGILCAMGVFLVSYKGYPKESDELLSDDLVATVAGVSIICVALFPVASQTASDGSFNWVNLIHLVSAVLFFLFIAYMSFYKFTRTGPVVGGSLDTERAGKNKRNRIYRICARVIVGSIALIILTEFLDWLPLSFKDLKLDRYSSIFWLETLALFAFGLSWLVKGDMIGKFSKRKSN